MLMPMQMLMLMLVLKPVLVLGPRQRMVLVLK